MADDRGDADGLAAVEDRLGHRFGERRLLEEALTHRSWANDHPGSPDWERLEYLGDSVLGLLASEWLFTRFADLREGDLSKLRAYLVSEASLAEAARYLDLGGAMRLSVGEARSGGREKAAVLADALEAVLAAVYLDAGLEPARRVTEPILEAGLDRWQEQTALRDSKTALQELVQSRGWELPDYRDIAAAGPDHDRTFTIECWVQGKHVGTGHGRSKKAAQQEAAREALARLVAL